MITFKMAVPDRALKKPAGLEAPEARSLLIKSVNYVTITLYHYMESGAQRSRLSGSHRGSDATSGLVDCGPAPRPGTRIQRTSPTAETTTGPPAGAVSQPRAKAAMNASTNCGLLSLLSVNTCTNQSKTIWICVIIFVRC